MTKKELKAAIRAKEKELRELHKKSNLSQDVAEVRSYGEQIDKIIDELDDLKAQLDELDEQENGSRSLDPFQAMGGTSRSFSMNGGSVAAVSENTAALKRGESLVSRLKLDNSKSLDLGKCIRGMVTGNWDNAAEERSAMDTSAMGAVIPQVLSARIIDQARNISLFAASGVPVYPMPNGNLKVARVASDPEFSFKAEGAEGEQVSFELDSVNLTAKTCYGYAYVSLEAIHSAVNLTDILYQVFSRAIADAMDKGGLYGQENDSDGVAPAGIMNDENINHIVAENVLYNDFIKAAGAVRRKNGKPTIWAINAATAEALETAHDDNNNYQEAPKALDSLQQVVTNQLAYDETTGSDALVFDPNAIAIGMQNNITVRMITDSDECIKKGIVGFQIYAMLDVQAVQPTHISKITGFTSPNAARIVTDDESDGE